MQATRTKTTIKIVKAVVGVVLAIAFMTPHNLFASKDSTAAPDRASYEKTLRELLQQNVQPDASSYEFLFEPSSRPEEQIVMQQTPSGWVVTLSQLKGENLYLLLQHIGKSRIDSDDLRSKLKVTHKSEVLSAGQAKEWIKRISAALAKNPIELNQAGRSFLQSHKVDIPLDGTYYIVTVRQGMSNLQATIYDEELGSEVSGQHELTKVINSIRLHLEAGR